MSTAEERDDVAFDEAEGQLAELGLVLEKGTREGVEVRTQNGRVVFAYGIEHGQHGDAWAALDGFVAGWRLLAPAVSACWSVFEACADMELNLGALDDVAEVLRGTDEWTPGDEEALARLKD